MLKKIRKAPFVREPITDLEDLRDDCIALFLNSKLTQKAVHERGGPTPHTISKWLYKETLFPRLDTIRALLQALECDLVVTPQHMAATNRTLTTASRLSVASDTPTRMPLRRKMKDKRKARRGR